jgi:hypothetical protein
MKGGGRARRETLTRVAPVLRAHARRCLCHSKLELPMSALGHKRTSRLVEGMSGTSRLVEGMSALAPKADIERQQQEVCATLIQRTVYLGQWA